MSAQASRRRAVFVDKDGTLIENIPYNVDVARMQFAPGAERAVPRLAAAGFAIVVVSNQAGVARGMFDEAAVAAVGRALTDRLAALGVGLGGFYYCPHDPRGAVARHRRMCGCRKPAPGLIVRAARELGVDLSASWLVGDILDDIEAGRRAGCRTILIDAGNETEWRMSRARLPHHVAADLDEAARLIVALDAAAETAGATRPYAAAAQASGP
ncbi:MAG TPA: HAD family hydrolase [Gammaproteobacteria bacterium]